MTDLLYSKHEVTVLFAFLNGSPLAKTYLDVNFILVGERSGMGKHLLSFSLLFFQHAYTHKYFFQF